MALVKSGNAEFSCPRCWLPTSNFHLNCTGATQDNRFMKKLTKIGKIYLESNRRTKAQKISKDFSFHVVQNAFWSVPHFENIYDCLVVDELHQLGGVYKHLLGVIEDILSVSDKLEVNKRAQKYIPHFGGRRRFNNEYLLSTLVFPTYDELKHHMGLNAQMVLCLRHFIDFAYQATSSEHTKDTLDQMEKSLELFNKYSPVAALYSKSFMAFPKNHALSKYRSDIESRGTVMGYSTCYSETQHKRDTKATAARTSFNKKIFTKQMGAYIARRDALYDAAAWHGQKSNNNHISSTLHSSCSYTLLSPSNRRKPISLDALRNHESEQFLSLGTAIRLFLDTDIEKRTSRVSLGRMPKLNITKFLIFKKLVIHTVADDDDEVYNETVRTNTTFRGANWCDFVELKGEYYDRPLLFFQGSYANKNLDMCFIERYLPIKNRTFVTDMEVLKLEEPKKVMQVSEIVRAVHIVPNFKTKKNEKTGHYEEYLLNHDANRHTWSENKGVIDDKLSSLVTWEDVEKEKVRRVAIKAKKRALELSSSNTGDRRK
ncbi:hypothetical protein INT45_001772 [Circinella minor]|uniref:Uncharacterized protein n=1 Tax=Circinella minor TaxID=1195481 RepID=A0A8H7RJJ8_9FUNG|nr:hypothetical protein INT45_001772 [Circinella minor]